LFIVILFIINPSISMIGDFPWLHWIPPINFQQVIPQFEWKSLSLNQQFGLSFFFPFFFPTNS